MHENEISIIRIIAQQHAQTIVVKLASLEPEAEAEILRAMIERFSRRLAELEPAGEVQIDSASWDAAIEAAAQICNKKSDRCEKLEARYASIELATTATEILALRRSSGPRGGFAA